MLQPEIKKVLLKKCKEFVNTRFQTITDIIYSNQAALKTETKSSAGDKHETGRAMLQLEIEKAGQQLSGVNFMKQTLLKIDISKTSKVAHLGSLIETNIATYFLSISAGELKIKNKTYYAISIASPIGKLLLGKTTVNTFIFNGKKIEINNIY
ncbi:MAG: 3-oxoacyl-ACP synthase [Polaribacter sp.]|uniref:3-oxoacyl-ACP synthase n=1 Tax=Polaribacter sp. TaxID=1920175 RepID=UPI0032669E2C